jgi:cytochrome d ubiquinol oxidase subunit I
MKEHEVRIRNGMVAYSELEKLRAGDRSPELLSSFKENQKDLGYGLLLKKYTPNVVDATEDQIQSAVKDSIPNVPAYSFIPCMVASGFLMLLLFILQHGLWLNAMQKTNHGYLNLLYLLCHYLGLQHKQVGM